MPFAPFDLTTFHFTHFADQVIIDATKARPPVGYDFPAIYFALSDGALDTYSGNDLIAGTVKSVIVPAHAEFIGFLTTGELRTSLGGDAVSGSVALSQPLGAHATGFQRGIDGDGIGKIATGPGADTVSGTVAIKDTGGEARRLEGTGIRDIAVVTGHGDDDVTGSTNLIGPGANRLFSEGMRGVLLDTRLGDDAVTAFAGATASAPGGDAFADALIGTVLRLGIGDDALQATAKAKAEADGRARAIAIEDSVIDTTAARIFEPPRAHDDDTIHANANAVGGVLAHAKGILASEIVMGGGADLLTAKATAQGTDAVGSATATGIAAAGLAPSLIATGNGDDSVKASASASATDDDGASAFGIAGRSSGRATLTIDTGRGDDAVIASGEATSSGADANGVGLSHVRVLLGAGDDTLKASGSERGVEGAQINGGLGDDIINVQSGDGTVDGGHGRDKLILEGDRADYIFHHEGFRTVDIEDRDTGGTLTNFQVTEVELFRFDDGEVSFHDLFV